MADRRSNEEIIESGVVHFRIGEDLGLRLMEIAQEHLTEGNDPVKALKTITESLHGCPTDIAILILRGDLVLPVDTESQQVICQNRIVGIHDHFPKVDACYWISKRHQDIEKHGENLITGFKALQAEIRKNNRRLTIDLPYDDIFKFVSGNDETMLDYLRDNYYEVDGICNIIETTKKYIEFSMSIMATMDWMLKTFNEFSDSKLYVEHNGMRLDCSQTLTDVMFVMKETLNFEFNLNQIDSANDNVQKYIDSAKEIDAIITTGIVPVDIMDNYSAGWLSPTGDYYGLNGEIANMLHNQIADALQEQGIIPDTKDEFGVEVNPDAWMEQNGWVKIHDNNINYAGCINNKLGLKNINITSVQIKLIYDYIQILHNGIMRLGWKQEKVSASKFEAMTTNNPDYLNKNYFSFD